MNDRNLAAEVVNEVKKAIVGKDTVLVKVLAVILARGHLLLEDIPGVGKTTLALAFARALDLQFNRMQFTPDVMPSDVTGFTLYNKAANRMEYQPGAVLCNLFLADELNRATSRTQSALLEAMEEGQVTVDGVSHPVPEPFMVIATQNSAGYVGTFPLPEAQLDRFMMKINMGYPSVEEETRIMMDRLTENPVDNVRQVMTAEQLYGCIEETETVAFAESLCRYIASIAAATRSHPSVELGVSPRASVAMMQACRAFAYLRGRDYVIPEDIVRLLIPVFEHRIVLKQEARLKRISAKQILEDVVGSVTPPIMKK